MRLGMWCLPFHEAHNVRATVSLVTSSAMFGRAEHVHTQDKFICKASEACDRLILCLTTARLSASVPWRGFALSCLTNGQGLAAGAVLSLQGLFRTISF